MRGDSLRDLYAKTLALVGLALLAGVGALVDYWPTRTQLPLLAASRIQPVTLASALSSRDVNLDVPAPVARVARAEPAVAPPAAEPPAPLPAALPVAVSTMAPGMTVALSAPPAPAPRPLAVVQAAADLPGPDVPLSTPAAIEARARAAEEDQGFLADATDLMKKTGMTIVQGSMKTGASIVDAFRIFGGTFKKLKFFDRTSHLAPGT